MVGVGAERDLEAVRAGLERWLRAQRPGAGDVRVGPLTQPSAGLSSQTLLVEVSSDEGGESLVARLPPAGEGLFPTYDLGLQAAVQTALADNGVPVAAPVAWEEDDAWVGAPFLLMPRVAGQIPAEQPPYWEKGWLRDAGPQQQAGLHETFLDVFAAIHRLDWERLGLGVAARPGGVGLTGELAWWASYVTWAGDGEVAPDLADALAWCEEHRPRAEPPPALLWGDCRLGNVVFDDTFRPAAVLDWEMTSIGPPELDVSWYVALRRMPGGRAELPGLPDRAATLAGYQQRLGRTLVDLRWFEVFALLRSEAILERIRSLLARQGVTDSWLSAPTPLRRRMGRLMAAGD
jgi:aminoglycoside phosphotransferase (APT) family kinase protein